MTTIDRIKAKLAAYPEVRYSAVLTGIEVQPLDGFAVGLTASPAGFMVHFDGWHEEFTSEDEALECFAFGLSSSCRLVVTLRGRTATKWTVETLTHGQWVEESTTGLVVQPFWRSRRVVYRQNHLLP